MGRLDDERVKGRFDVRLVLGDVGHVNVLVRRWCGPRVDGPRVGVIINLQQDARPLAQEEEVAKGDVGDSCVA